MVPLDQSDRTSYERSAISIFQCHFGSLQQSLWNPISVACFLHNVKIISETVLNSVKSTSQTLEDRRIILLTGVQDAIHTNYQFVKMFAEVLLKFTENVPLAKTILEDYSKCVGIYCNACMLTMHSLIVCVYLCTCVYMGEWGECTTSILISIFLLMGIVFSYRNNY